MKKQIMLPAVSFLVFAVLLSACGQTLPAETTEATTSASTEASTEETKAQTGYSHGEIQLTTVFIEDTLYQPNMNHWATFENGEETVTAKKLELYGTTLSENNAAYPDTHLEASRLAVGTPIYRDGEGKF